MKKFGSFIVEAKFNNWVRPSEDALKQEYFVEYELKNLKSLTNDAWPKEEDFLNAAAEGKVTTITPAMDRKISYRSGTTSFEQLHNLIKGYKSYPQYRNEKTLRAIYDGFDKGNKMKMPIVLKFKNGSMRVLGGNTRMDIAFQKGINPKVLMIAV